MLAFTALSVFVSASAAVTEASANSKYSGIVIDAKTGKTLYSYKADTLRYPASLTKMMTMYMMFEALHNGKITKKTRIRISKNAANEVPSKLGIPAGRTISANDAILSLATKSANDVATAVAEHLGGSEANFARMMTSRARSLGMKNTTFRNAHGLTAKGQLTTARDMAMLGVALREHYPQYYGYFSTRVFKYGKARYGNHNRLLGRVRGVDGIKTGYTRASGFNLVSSVEDRDRSIVAVVIGGRSGKSRNAQMVKLIGKYLPKASRRSKKMLVASRQSINPVLVAAAEIKLPKRGPVPVFRAREAVPTSSPVVLAAAAAPVSQFANNQPFDQAAVQARLYQSGSAPVPSSRPTSAYAPVDNVVTAAVRPSVAVGSTAAAPAAPAVKPASVSAGQPSGWIIQVGATDSRQSAIGLLASVRDKAPGTLGNKGTYTETVVKGDETLHRARFTGFSSKNEARQACKTLKAKRVACLALNA